MHPDPEERAGEAAGPLRSRLVRGALWMGGALWATRGLGLVNTVILARLLTPADFGLVAMATVVTGFLTVLLTYGVDTALIQNAQATRADWDTAWSVQVGQGILLAALVAVLAPAAAAFYGDPRVSPVMLVLAGGVVIASFENIGIVGFRKDLQFDRAFLYAVVKKVFQVAVTVPLALLLHDYWALIAGTILTQAFSTCLSYRMHPFRPHWSVARLREILGFTSRIAFTNLARYITFDGERVIIGAVAGARLTGLYYVAAEFAQMPTAELSGAFAQATFAGLAKLGDDRERLRAGYLNAFGAVALYALPAGIGIAIVAPDLVSLLLGAQWASAIPVFRVMAIAGALRAVYGTAYNLLVVRGRLNRALLVSWFEAGLQLVLLAPTIERFGVVGAAALNCALAMMMLVFCVVEVARGGDASVGDHLKVLWRPLLASTAMTAVCLMVTGADAAPILSLFCTVTAGAAAYAVAALGLWLLCGHPPGPEEQLLDMAGLRRRFARVLR